MFWRTLITLAGVLALGATAAAQQQAPQQPLQGAPTTAAQPAEKATPPADMKFLKAQNESQFLADEEVIGKDVANVKGETVGTIADLVMDQDQKLVGIVLSVGGFLGIGDKWVAVPVDQIEFPTDQQPARLRVEVTEEQLTNAPDFVTKQTKEAERQAEKAQQQQPPTPAPAPATAQ
jgi:hypothetical protein